MRGRQSWAAFLALLLLTGCTDDGRLPTYKVSGKVTLEDGTPVGPGTIFFESQDHSVTATGSIEPNGTFQLTTYEEGDGAVAGWHTAAVVPATPEGVDPDAIRQPPPPIDQSYMHPDTSGLRYEVGSDGPNEIPVILKRRR